MRRVLSARLQARGCAEKVIQKPEKASLCAQNNWCSFIFSALWHRVGVK